MRKWKAWLAITVVALAISACAAAETPAPTATQAAVAAAESTATTAPTNTTAPSPTAANTPTEAPVVDACVECHTDKDQLIDTAAPQEVVVEESEGAG